MVEYGGGEGGEWWWSWRPNVGGGGREKVERE